MKQETKTEQPQRQNPAPHAAEDKRKKTKQDFQRQAQQNKKRWMPFVRFIKKQGLKFKNARCSKFRVEYFRTDELQSLIEQKKQQIEKDQVLRDLVRTWQKEVIYFVRPQNLQKFKYPQELQRSEGNSKAKFASFKFDTAEPKTWLFPAILIGVIAVVLFPLWPYSVKYAVFMVAFVLLTALISLITLRLIIYLFFAIFGISFWIIPNLFADTSVIESFIPFYSYKKWQGGVFSIVGRLIALSIFGYYAYQLYIDSSWVYENIEITKTSFEDLHDWGVGKIKGEKNFSQSALTNLDHIMNQTAEVDLDEQVDLGAEQSTQQVETQDGQENTSQL